jgi:hypothetical protein
MHVTLKVASQIVTIGILVVAPGVYAQESHDVMYQVQSAGVQGPGPVSGVAMGAVMRGSPTPVKGAPYSATITNESVQTLADGNRIVQTSTGSTARDSQGRTRQETVLPSIGNLSAAEAPHLVFIQDPVGQTAYTLNLTDKTAQKIPMPPPMPPNAAAGGGVPEAGVTFSVQAGPALGPDPTGPIHVMSGSGAGVAVGPIDGTAETMHVHKVMAEAQGQATTEDLGTQTMEGVIVSGVRTTRTIPAGQMGNEKPIVIVTEVWTSPDLKTIVSSKRSDPRMGEQSFRLTNLVRAEPDEALFSVPSDFRVLDGPKQIMYRSNR